MSDTTKWRERYGPWGLVTGASDGIGREFARQLAKRGLNLVMVARRREVLDGLALELGGKYGIETLVIAAIWVVLRKHSGCVKKHPVWISVFWWPLRDSAIPVLSFPVRWHRNST